MSLFALFVVGLLCTWFWRQLLALLVAGVVLLLVFGIASLLHASAAANGRAASASSAVMGSAG